MFRPFGYHQIYIHLKQWSKDGVSSAANSECAYLLMAKRLKHVVDNYHVLYLYRSRADGNK
jgi:hypothetical protein